MARTYSGIRKHEKALYRQNNGLCAGCGKEPKDCHCRLNKNRRRKCAISSRGLRNRENLAKADKNAIIDFYHAYARIPPMRWRNIINDHDLILKR